MNAPITFEHISQSPDRLTREEPFGARGFTQQDRPIQHKIVSYRILDRDQFFKIRPAGCDYDTNCPNHRDNCNGDDRDKDLDLGLP